jgi:hypothetical protein
MRLPTLTALAVMGLLLMNSCVVWKFDTLLTERNRDDVPKIAGRYIDSKGMNVTIKATQFSNTYLVTPQDGESGEVRVTLENIAPKRFLVQGTMDGVPGLPPFLLSVAEIDGKKITLYLFLGLDEKLAELGKKHGVTLEEIGFKSSAEAKEVFTTMLVVTAYDSVEGVIGFFNDLFSVEGAQKVTATRK